MKDGENDQNNSLLKVNQVIHSGPKIKEKMCSHTSNTRQRTERTEGHKIGEIVN